MTSHPVDRAARDAPWFRPGVRVLVACSGGPDSMALLHAAAALVPLGVHVVAAHFNHRIREDSARDLETVRAFADARGVRVVAGAGDVPARARAGRVSLETAAREARYAFLRRAAADEHAHWIATAHTRSDQVETVLMRVLRGAGERGLAGIARERDGVARPLLDVTRSGTLDYCARRGIAFVVDPSNEDRRHARNAVRHDVLPALRRVYPGIDDALVRMSQRAEETLNTVRRVTDVRLSRLRRENDAWVLPVDALAGLDDSEAAILLGDVMERVECLEDVAAVHYGHLRALARDERVGASASLPGVSVRRDHDALVWRPRREAIANREAAFAVRLEIPGTVGFNGWIVAASLCEGGHETGHADTGLGAPPGASPCRSASLAEPRSDWKGLGTVAARPARASALPRLMPAIAAMSVRLSESLVVRSPRPGDRIRPFGMNGTRKLSDVFIDRKVPHRERARVVVVEAGGEIVWVPGVVAAESTRVRDGDAPALLLTASREAS